MTKPVEIGDVSEMGQRYLDGHLKQHRLTGDFEVSQRESIEHLGNASDDDRARWLQRGLSEVRDGNTIFGVLAAGASSRMDLTQTPTEVQQMLDAAGIEQIPSSKALVPVHCENRDVYTFLDLFLINVQRFAAAADAAPQTLVFVSEKNKSDIEQHIEGAFDDQALREQMRTLVQPLAPQIIARQEEVVERQENFEDEAAWREACELSAQYAGCNLDVPKPAGHGEFFHQLVESGMAGQLLNDGIRYVSIRNIDNVPAVLDAAWLTLFGYLLEQDLNFLVEVSERTAQQKGGALIRHEGQWRLAEDPSFQGTQVSASDSFFINNAVAIFKLDYLFPIYETSAQELVEVSLANDSERLSAIAERGRRRFPTIVEAKPVSLPSGSAVGAITPETNMWESTAVAGDQPLSAMGVYSEADEGAQISQLDADEQRRRCRRLRFAPVKKWSDYCDADKKTIIGCVAERVLHGDLLKE